MSDRLAKWSAYAGIISAVLASIALGIEAFKPEAPIIHIIQERFPFLTFFLFVFGLVGITYFLINKIVDRIGDTTLVLHGDVITTNHVVDYVTENVDKIDRTELEKILEATMRRSDSQDLIIDKLVESLDTSAQESFVLQMSEKIIRAGGDKKTIDALKIAMDYQRSRRLANWLEATPRATDI